MTAKGEVDPQKIEAALLFAEAQAEAMLEEFGHLAETSNPDWGTNPAVFPKGTQTDSGDVEWGYSTAGGNWGAGFTPGLFWDLYELTGDGYWRTKAEAWTEGVRGLKTAGGDMRMNLGFHFMNSFARRIAHGAETGDADVLQEAVDTLLLSWMPEVGSFYSFTWRRGQRYDGLQGGWQAYENAIIDSAPNMELPLYQAKRTEDVVLWDKTLSHFDNLIRDNIRTDGSTGQLAAYDTDTGEFLGLRGHQGYGPESTWSRGQGWALHGFASAWRETGDPRFGEIFDALFAYYRDNAPADGVPYWDFIAPELTEAELDFRYPDRNAYAIRLARDTSAAALAASALMEAVPLAETDAKAREYFAYGSRILDTLTTPGFLAMDGNGDPVRESILRQGSYTFPGIDKGLIWGDFFFVEALRRYVDLTSADGRFAPGATGDFTAYRGQGWRRWTVRPDEGDARLFGFNAASPEASDPRRFLLHGEPVRDLLLDLALKPDGPPGAMGTAEACFVFDYRNQADYRFFRISEKPGRTGYYARAAGTESLLQSFEVVYSEDGYARFRVYRDASGITLQQEGTALVSVAEPLPEDPAWFGFAVAGGSAFFDIESATLTPASPAVFAWTGWREDHFGTSFFLQALPGADPDNDGRTNEEEYILGTNPVVADDARFPLAIELRETGQLAFSFPWNPARTGVRYTLQVSTDGGDTWENLTGRMAPGGPDAVETTVMEIPAGDSALYRVAAGGEPYALY